MYSALDVSKYIIKRCNENGYTISNLKLQKILYFVQAEFLVCIGRVCFPENIQAWDFGPVVSEVYHRYKVYGSANIPYVRIGDETKILSGDRELMDGIIDECSQYSASRLVEITHNQDPWRNAYRPYMDNVITPQSIKKYFEEE